MGRAQNCAHPMDAACSTWRLTSAFNCCAPPAGWKERVRNVSPHCRSSEMGSPAWLPETAMPAANATGNAATVLAYHERSKHRLERHASGPETLDWDAQPDPFCRFAGAPLTRLPLPTDDTTHWTSLFSPGAIAPHAATLESLGLLFELSFALSAWKRLGPDRWLLRCNPSSGNHPTEIYARAGWEIWMKVCTTTHQRNTRWNDAPGSRASNSTPVCRVRWSASVQSTGARDGSTANARSATASSTWAMRSERCVMHVRCSAG